MKFTFPLALALLTLTLTGCKQQTQSAASPASAVTAAVAAQVQDSAASTSTASDEEQINNGKAMVEAREREIEAEDQRASEENMSLPDDKRDRYGSLSGKDTLVEKATNMRMRLDKKTIVKNGISKDVIEYKFIENNKIYGFDFNDYGNCHEYIFDIKKVRKTG